MKIKIAQNYALSENDCCSLHKENWSACFVAANSQSHDHNLRLDSSANWFEYSYSGPVNQAKKGHG